MDVMNFNEHDVKVFTDNIEQTALDQLEQLVSIDVFSKSKIRIMPDVHAGSGCVIGFTADLGDRVIPNLVGVDIGCGIYALKLNDITTNFKGLDDCIREWIPSGRDIRDTDKTLSLLSTYYQDIYSKAKELVNELICYRELKDVKKIYKSIGTLGGGNHFIEIDTDASGNQWLLVHTGSRNLGKQVCDIYQKLAVKNRSGWDELMKVQAQMIVDYKAQGRKSELQDAIRELHNSFKMKNPDIPRDLCYLEDSCRVDYLHDMRLCQEWADLNRMLILEIIVNKFFNSKLELQGQLIKSVHNYIGDDNIIRKGSISAYEGQSVVIPLNMRDGSIIGVGLGNEDWNYSAPHGAGRVMSRSQAFKTLKLEDFQKSMEGINTWSVNEETIDESPMVYKPADEILSKIKDTVRVIDVIKPIYNFKASESKFIKED